MLNVEEVRDYCLAKKGVTESFPFDADTLVFKVMGKMFALVPLKRSGQINLKCDPDYALELRAAHSEVREGWHMSKKHWNTVIFNEGLPNDLFLSLIDHSYDLVVKGLKKSVKAELENL